MLDLSSLEKACDALESGLMVYAKSALAEDDPVKILLRDGVIQRYEFTYELSLDLLRRCLAQSGLGKADGLKASELFRLGQEQDLISDTDKWFYYLTMREQTSQAYDKVKAAAVFAAAREFMPDSQYLLRRLRKMPSEPNEGF
jgi:nucleotidyltransferase substrate binding protein (TIGR01987 family)